MDKRPDNQALSDLAYTAKELVRAYDNRQSKKGKLARIDTMDAVEILHAIARYMTIHNIER